MKKIIILLVLVFISCEKQSLKATLIPSKIDSLNSKKEVEDFIRPLDEYFRKFELKSISEFNRPSGMDSDCRKIAKKFNLNKSFCKADFDNNGYQDLLFTGDDHQCEGSWGSCDFSAIVIMNFPNDSLKPISIVKRLGVITRCLVPKVVVENDSTFLEIHSPNGFEYYQLKKRETYATTKLIYKFGDFIEYNTISKKHQISKIEFSTTGCLGTCPVFDLTINKDKTSLFSANYYNFSKDEIVDLNKKEGNFKTIIHDKDYQEIIDLLNYINFSGLENDYSVSWTDDQFGTLKITYDDGEVKTISDYGMVGTYGLKRLYKILYDLRFNQDWK